jgi:predicted amidophosphoribosyltransferase
MRDRHFPRLCRSCRAPMARQEDTCWRCDTHWAAEDGPRTTLQVIAGGADTQVADRPQHRTVAVADTARAAADARLDADRWMNEGGSFDSEAAALLRAVP